MTAGTDALKQAFRDYTTDGIPASGENEPQKSEIRAAIDSVGLDIASAAGGTDLDAVRAVIEPVRDEAIAAADEAEAWNTEAAANALASRNKGARLDDAPNVFTPDELAFRDLSRLSVSAAASLTIVRAASGRRIGRFANASGTVTNCLFSVSRTQLDDQTTYSTSMTVESVTSDSSTRSFVTRQKNAAGTVIAGTTQTLTLAVSSARQYPAFSNLAIDATCATIETYLSFSGTTTQVDFRDQMISGGNDASFIDSPRPINLWPDPRLTSVGQLEAGERIFSQTATGTILWTVSAVDALAPGAFLSFTTTRAADIAATTGATHGFIFYDGAGAEISRVTNNTAGTVGVYKDFVAGGVIPAGTVTIGFFMGKSSGGTYAKFKRPIVTSSLSRPSAPITAPYIVRDRRVFVAASGSLSGTGSASSPVSTLAAAVASERLIGGGEIVMADSTEFTTTGLSVTGINGPLFWYPTPGNRPTISRFIKLASITKTAGYTKVYQAALTSLPTSSIGATYFWHMGVPDPRTVIGANRWALNRGATYGLEHTRLEPVASIAAVDASAIACYYYDSTAQIVYFCINSGGDATASDIRVPSAGSTIGFANLPRLYMQNIEVLGGLHAISAQNLAFADFRNMRMGLTLDNVLQQDNSHWVESTDCDIFGSGNDGANCHAYGVSLTLPRTVVRHRGLWSRWNWGDGASDHEAVEGSYDDCLFEYNGKAGNVPAQGAHVRAANCVAKNNGLITPGGGGGFAITNATGDSGYGTQFDLWNCLSYDNSYNFMCGPADSTGGTTSADHSMRTIGCKSRNASVAGYYARVGTLRHDGCTDKLSAVATLTANGGQIINESGVALV